MYNDAALQVSSAQAVTAAAASDNYIDLQKIRDIGTGEDLYVVATVTAAFTDSGSDSTLQVDLQTDDNSSFSSATTAQTVGIFGALSAVGAQLIAKLQPGLINERYLRAYYTPANGSLSTGAVSLMFTTDIQKYVSYAKGYTIS